MGSLSILLVISMIGAVLAEDVQQSPTLELLTRRYKRQGTLQQQLQNTQNQQQQQQQQNQWPQSNFPNNNWSNGNGNANAGGFQTQLQNTNQGSATIDAETQRVNNCIQQNCRQGIQLASLCGTDNVSYKNRPYFNCVRDCGRRIDIQHYGDCWTTRGAPVVG